MEENIHPLKFIAQTFNKSLADVARELGVTRQTINEWVGKKRKPIPEKRIKQLAEIFDLDESYFRKAELSPSEKLKIQIIKLEREDVAHEVPVFDDEGNEVGTTIWYENEGIIRQLSDEQEKLERIERLHSEIDRLVLKRSIEDELNSDVEEYSDNLSVFYSVVGILKSNNKEHQMLLKLLLDLLDLDRMEIDDEIAMGFYTPDLVSRVIPRNKKQFAKELLELLFKHSITTNELLRKYLNDNKN
jgi:transcriptional regulator with XRE-family HTH domain